MKRKIVKQGEATMTLSLPTSWIKKFNLKQGDFVEVQEIGKSLVINTEKEIKSDDISIDITGRYDTYVLRKIFGLYVSGVNKITIKHDNQLEIIRKITNRLIGFAIIKQEKNICIIQELSGIGHTDFETLFKRCFRILIDEAEFVLNLVKSNKKVENIEIHDYTLNQFTDYCLRYLNKHGHEDFQKTTLYYHTIIELEYVGDILTRLDDLYISSKKTKTIIILEKIIKLIEELYFVCFNHNEDKMEQLMKNCKKIRKEYADANDSVVDSLIEIIYIIENTSNSIMNLSDKN